MKYRFTEEIEEEPLVNLTPLIDIVFVILMAFIVAVPLIKLDSIALAPGTQEQEVLSSENDSIAVIKVFADHSLTLNEHPITLQELTVRLTLLHKAYPEKTPLLLQDGETSFRTYQNVKNAIEAAGFHELHVALQN
ncbi:ExbD [Chlamydia pneumoniae TW-183]|uniref:Biopolymer Transport Protein n=2 Tax=Chlamydia pneumoniae TaxID=83558 RepID=Q9Z7C2_CHLPN|nr:biopolymer transporter ExbD [Chlamydia pneumoniae]AAD18922.1 Biopolymer Transport Protein [Chlamydia pneumoniae CWL029]AAF38859.1 ExbD/TolR family protein [Chlamydia pneumoniae AR39]AAP98741.1 ExbD [Chlamydia pneumoniae TW-183]ACZ32673.1 tolR protein-like protein [Chlamydia pneumoniae LPCoLN]CRI33303.1 TolR protein-like protein [Chlamydia pneumoniae]